MSPDIWRNPIGKAVILAVLILLGACNTTGNTSGDAPVQSVEPAAAAAEPAETPVENDTSETQVAAKPVEEEELFYEPDSLTFNIRLSAALRSADNTLFLKTPSGVNLNEIPDDLDKWLSRIRDHGGTVKAAELPPEGEPNRSLIGILIDVILFFVGLAKDEIIYSAIDDFDAVLYFDKASGDVRWVVFTRRA